MQKEKFISGMNGHIVLSPMERERIIQRSVEREHWVRNMERRFDWGLYANG